MLLRSIVIEAHNGKRAENDTNWEGTLTIDIGNDPRKAGIFLGGVAVQTFGYVFLLPKSLLLCF